MPARRPATIDQYLGRIAADKRAALQRLRAAIKTAAPEASECISYGMPAFRLDGRVLVCFAAWSDHCSLYPMSGALIETMAADLKACSLDKGTIRFAPDHPLPAALVRKIVRARIAQNRAKRART